MHSNMTPSNYKQRSTLQDPYKTSILMFAHTLSFVSPQLVTIFQFLFHTSVTIFFFLSRTVSYATIKNHLSSLHLFYQLHNISTDFPKDFWISLTLCGIKRITGNTQSRKLPITPSILNRIYTTVDLSSSLDCVFWTACLLAFSHSFGSPICFCLLPHILTLNVT